MIELLQLDAALTLSLFCLHVFLNLSLYVQSTEVNYFRALKNLADKLRNHRWRKTGTL